MTYMRSEVYIAPVGGVTLGHPSLLDPTNLSVVRRMTAGTENRITDGQRSNASQREGANARTWQTAESLYEP